MLIAKVTAYLGFRQLTWREEAATRLEATCSNGVSPGTMEKAVSAAPGLQYSNSLLGHLDFAISEFREMKMQPALERALGRRGLLKA